jgi:hypothetical protein
MFVFDNSEDLDIATYEYRLYTEDQVEADPSNPGYYRLDGNVSINSGTITPYRQGFNLANVFTVSVENSTTTSTTSTTSAVSYYGAIRGIDTSTNAGPWTLIKKTSTDTPLIDEEFIGSLTAAKITTGTIGAAEITLNGANSIIKSSNYSAGLLGWKITGLGDAEFNELTVRTALDIGGSDASSFHVDIDGNLWLGASTYGSAPFRISNTGNVDVGGTDASSFHIDNAGNIWAGAGTFNTSTNPFSVTAAGALRASSVTITGGTVGGVNTSANTLFLGTGTYSNINTPFFVGLHSGVNKFSLGTGLTWDGATLTINGGGTFTGTLQVGDVEIGNDVGPGAGHYGISLSTTDFNNIFLRRSDGVYFFRVGNGGSNSLTWDSSSGVLNVTGTINAAGGTITGYLTSGGVDIGVLRPDSGYYKGINLSPNNATQFQSCFLRGNGGEVYLRADNGSQWIKFENGTVQIKAAGFEVTGSSAAFSGTVTAAAGTIGGYTIGATSLTTTAGSSSFGKYSSVSINSNGLINSYYQDITIFSTLYENVKINGYADGGSGAINITGTANFGSLSETWYTSYGVSGPSDIRLKNLIEEDVDALSLIENIQTTKFVFKNDETERQHFGFIAQQVHEHIPNAATPGGEDPQKQPWGIVQANFIPYLVKSIQQLSAKVEELESRLV